jgi:ABC-type dipeptide/oligopeptide/nickel transport system permease component
MGMGFRSFLVRRIVIAIIMLFVVLSINYVLFFVMPGNPASLFTNPRVGIGPLVHNFTEILRARWGFDQPPQVRYLLYLKNMLSWNFGDSLISGQSIASEMLPRLWNTLELMGGSSILGILIGVSLGVLVAYKRGGKFDSSVVTASLITYSLPVFWMGLVLILIFTVNLGWFPSAGSFPYDWGLPGRWPVPYTVSAANGTQWTGSMVLSVSMPGTLELLSGYLSHLMLPLITLTLFTYGGYLLLTRATMIEALTEDYISTARAKGVPERSVIFKHALKNASLPLITSAALAFGFMISGAIITEGVFSWPGMGRWIFQAIGFNDYSVLQSVFYIIAVLVILANIIADVLYGIIDPRIKYG